MKSRPINNYNSNFSRNNCIGFLYNLIVWGFILSILLMNISLLAFILLASFGLWKGKEWGWWLTNIYFIQMLFGMIISTIKLLYFVPKQYEGIEIGISNMFSLSGILAIIFGLLIPFYLFRKNTLDYFKINNYKLKLLIITIVAVIWNFVYSLLFN